MPRNTFDPYSSPNPKRFRRSRTEKMIAGVCGGIAERFDWDPILVRLLVILLTIFGLGPLALIGYVVIWMITPRATDFRTAQSPEEDQFWRNVADRPRATFGTIRYTFMDLDERLKNLERTVTSDEWRLREEFRDLEGRS